MCEEVGVGSQESMSEAAEVSVRDTLVLAFRPLVPVSLSPLAFPLREIKLLEPGEHAAQPLRTPRNL